MLRRHYSWDGSSTWNLATLRTPHEPLDPSRLELAVALLLPRHDALLARVVTDRTPYIFSFSPEPAGTHFRHLISDAATEPEIDGCIQYEGHCCEALLNLVAGPACAFTLLDFPVARTQRLMIVISHYLCDQWSLNLILHDLENALSARAARWSGPSPRAHFILPVDRQQTALCRHGRFSS